MKRWLLVCVMLCASMVSAQDQPAKSRWAAWQPFLGTWVGSGSGQPGQGAGEFTLEKSLQGAVLARTAPSAVFEAFCATRLSAHPGFAYGTLDTKIDADAVLALAMPQR